MSLNILKIAACPGSSLTYAKKHIDELSHGTLLLFEKHGMTRGRRDRIWQQLPGQALLTYVFKPNLTTDSLEALYHKSSHALYKALVRFVPHCTIKEPNDCMINGKKVAGILIEPVWQDDQLKAFVIGIGINISTPIAQLQTVAPMATSMQHKAPGDYTVALVTEEVSLQLSALFCV